MVKDNILQNLQNMNKMMKRLKKFEKDFVELSIFSYSDQAEILFRRGLKNNRGSKPSVKSIVKYREVLKLDENGDKTVQEDETTQVETTQVETTQVETTQVETTQQT